jgi:intracellular septation protein A
MLKFTFYFVEATHEPMHLLLDSEVLCSDKSWTYLQVLFEQLFYFTELLNMAVVRNFKVMLRQTLNHSV